MLPRAGLGQAHLQIHSNPAKSCSAHCFETCTVLQGLEDLLRVSLHLLTYMKAQDRGLDVLVKECTVIVQQHLKCPALDLHLRWKAFTAHTDLGYRQAGFQRRIMLTAK